jgi:hypothetical protein
MIMEKWLQLGDDPLIQQQLGGNDYGDQSPIYQNGLSTKWIVQVVFKGDLL